MSVTLTPAGGGVTINPAAPVSSNLAAHEDTLANAAAEIVEAERRYRVLENNLHRARQVKVYVDANGDDDAAGTEAAPLQTLTAALGKAPPGGTLAVHMKTNIFLDAFSPCDARLLQLFSDNADTRRTLALKVPDTVPETRHHSAYWILMTDPDAIVQINDIDLNMQTDVAALDNPAVIVGVAQLMLRARNSHVRGRGDGQGAALLAGGHAYALAIEQTSVLNMPGNWISRVAPRTPKADVPGLLWSTVNIL